MKETVETRPIEKPDPRWVKYWAEVQMLKQTMDHSKARRMAWERAFGEVKGGNEN